MNQWAACKWSKYRISIVPKPLRRYERVLSTHRSQKRGAQCRPILPKARSGNSQIDARSTAITTTNLQRNICSTTCRRDAAYRSTSKRRTGRRTRTGNTKCSEGARRHAQCPASAAQQAGRRSHQFASACAIRNARWGFDRWSRQTDRPQPIPTTRQSHRRACQTRVPESPAQTAQNAGHWRTKAKTQNDQTGWVARKVNKRFDQHRDRTAATASGETQIPFLVLHPN